MTNLITCTCGQKFYYPIGHDGSVKCPKCAKVHYIPDDADITSLGSSAPPLDTFLPPEAQTSSPSG